MIYMNLWFNLIEISHNYYINRLNIKRISFDISDVDSALIVKLSQEYAGSNLKEGCRVYINNS